MLALQGIDLGASCSDECSVVCRTGLVFWAGFGGFGIIWDLDSLLYPSLLMHKTHALQFTLGQVLIEDIKFNSMCRAGMTFRRS